MRQPFRSLLAGAISLTLIALVSCDRFGRDKSAATGDPSDVTEISFLYSTEKREWIEAAVAAFKKQDPAVKIKLIGKGSLAAAQSILEGKEKPTVWSPADTVVLKMLEADWRLQTHSNLFAPEGIDAPDPLVLTPLVFVVWQDRAEVLEKLAGSTLSFKVVHQAVSSDQGWPAVGGKADWGFVKLGHTDPTQSNSGLQSLVLMTLDYYGKRGGLSVSDVLKPDYQTWLKQIEKGVSHFESSTGIFMEDMVKFGPAKYDIALVYESIAISQMENARSHWGNLKIEYPPMTLWSDHPAAILQTEWVTPAQKDAARRWLAFLHSQPMQERALEFGFRPSDSTISLKTADPTNPFNRLASSGLRVDVPPVVAVPDPAVVKSLLSLWTRIVSVR